MKHRIDAQPPLTLKKCRRIDEEALGNRYVCKLYSLFDLSAMCVASHLPFEYVETTLVNIPDPVQERILYYSFPRDNADLKTYSSFTNCGKLSSEKSPYGIGEHLFLTNCVENVIQIGFHLTGVVKTNVGAWMPVECKSFKVSMTFDRCKITSISCTCNNRGLSWCPHAVALALFRISKPNSVDYRSPISDTLVRMDRSQLQKFAQYLIASHPNRVLASAQQLADRLLQQDSTMNKTSGAPDPTAGAAIQDTSTWFLDEAGVREQLRLDLAAVAACAASPTGTANSATVAASVAAPMDFYTLSNFGPGMFRVSSTANTPDHPVGPSSRLNNSSDEGPPATGRAAAPTTGARSEAMSTTRPSRPFARVWLENYRQLQKSMPVWSSCSSSSSASSSLSWPMTASRWATAVGQSPAAMQAGAGLSTATTTTTLGSPASTPIAGSSGTALSVYSPGGQVAMIFAKACELLSTRDANGPRLLAIITEELINCARLSLPKLRRSFRGVVATTDRNAWESTSDATIPELEDLDATDVADLDTAAAAPTPRYFAQQQSEGAATTANSSQPPPAWTIPLWEEATRLWTCFLLSPGTSESSRQKWRSRLLAWSQSPRSPRDETYLVPQLTTPPAVEQLTSSVVPTQSPLLRPPSSCLSANQRPARNHSVFKLAIEAGSLPLQKGLWLLSGANPCTGVRAQLSPNALSDLSLSMPSNVQQCTCPFCGVSLLLSKTWCLNETFVALCLRVSSLASTGYREEATNLAVSLSVLLLDCVEEVSRRRTMPGAARIWQPPEEGAEAMASAQWSRLYSAPCSPPAYAPPGLANLRSPSAGKGGSPCSLSVNTSCANAGPTGPGWYHSTSPLPGPSGGAAALPLPPSRTPPTFKSPPPPISPGCFGGSSRYGRGVSSGFSFGDGGGAQWQSVPGAPFIHPPPPLYPPPPPPPPPHPRYHAYPNANFESAQTAPGEAGLRSPIIGPLRRGPVGVGCLPFTVPRPPSRSPLPPPPASRYPNRSPSVSDPLSETFLSSLLFSEASTNCPSHECGWLGLPGRPIISLVECLFEAAAVRLQQEEEEVEEMGEKDESEGHEVESERTKQNATSGSSRNIHNETLSAVDYIHLALKVGIVALCQQRRLPTSSGLLLACQAQETRLLLLLDTVPRNATTAHEVGQLVCQLMGPPSNLSPPSSSSARSPTPSASASSAAVAAAATTSAASTNCGLDLWWWSALGSVVHPDSYPIHVVAEFLFGHLLAGETAGAGTGELAYLVAARSMRLPMLEPFSDSLALNSGIGQNRQNDRSGSSPAIPTAISTMPGRPSNLYSAPLLPTEQAAHFRFAGSVEPTDIPSHHHHPPLPSVLAAAAFAGASGVVAPCYESPLRFRHPSTSAAAAAVGLQPPAPLLSAQQTADQAQHYPAGAPDLAQPPVVVAAGAATTDTYRRGLEALEAKQTRLAISLILASRSALHRMDHFMRLCDRHIHAALSLLTISREVFVEATGHRPSIESSSPFDALSLSVSAATAAAAAAAAAAASTVSPPAPSPLGVLLPVFLLPSHLSPAASPPVLQERIHLVCAAFHLALNVARRTATRVHWRRREMLAWVVSTALLLGPSALLYLLNRWTLYMSPREAVNWLAPTLFACMALPGGEGAQLPLRSQQQLQQPITFQQQRHHLTPAAAAVTASTQSVARRHSSLLRPRYHHHNHNHRSGLMMRTASETVLGTGYPAHGGASRSQYQLHHHHYVGLRDAAMAGSSQAVGANSGVGGGGGSGSRDYSTAPRIHSFLPYTPPHREQVVAAVRQMAMQAAAQDPVNCAMATLHLTEKDAAAFEAAYRLVLEAAEAGSLGPGLLFTLARYLDRRGCPLRAFPLAIHAMRLFSLSNLQESHPVAHDVLWACLLAHRIGPATLQEMLSYVVRNVHCPTLLADILHRCRIPPQSPHFQSALQRPRFSATAAAASRVADSDWVASDVRGSSGRNRGLSDPALLLATPACDQAACGLDKQQQQFLLPVDLPPLKALLDATISAFVTTTNTRLANISPRQYAEFVEFLGRARDAFNLLKPDGPAQFRNLVGYLCHSYRGKRKLVALLNERFNS